MTSYSRATRPWVPAAQQRVGAVLLVNTTFSGRHLESQLEKGIFYASLKIVGKLAYALNVEPAEMLRLPPKRDRR